MTELRITPNLDKKSAKFHGTIAAGERVHIVIQSDVAFGDNLRFRAVSVGGKTLAQFPYDDEYKWDIVDGAYECDLNLNTVQMLEVVPAGATVPILFVLDDAVENTLYFKDFTNVTHWPRKEGEDIPVDLSGYVDYYKEIQDNISSIESQIAKKADMTALEAEAQRATDAEAALGKAIDTKVDAVEGMGLSSNDYTAEEKEKLGKAYSPDNPPPPPDLSGLLPKYPFVFKDGEELYGGKIKITCTSFAINVYRHPNTNGGILVIDLDAAEDKAGEKLHDANDYVLVIDCRSSVVPLTIEWSTKFHPRTDIETDFACRQGKINVYWISKYYQNSFVVAGWVQTTGGNV
jgi:hypothetical protein